MLNTPCALNGMITAPHHLAAQAGLSVLKEGGTAVEAMVAAAASIAVVYPHMNALGGDGFWLIAEPGKDPVGIDAAGRSAGLATLDWYKDATGGPIPARGPLAALTVGGAIGGWGAALDHLRAHGRDPLPLPRLLADAIDQARDGMVVTQGQENLTREKLDELKGVPGFAETYLEKGEVPKAGTVMTNKPLAAMLARLAEVGLQDFYSGDVARSNASWLEQNGSPLRLGDFEAQQAKTVKPLTVKLASGQVFNMPPPTQGVSSLMILGLFERLGIAPGAQVDGFDYLHGLVEATKQAFILRNAHLTDLDFMEVDPRDWLSDATLDELAGKIDRAKALPWPYPPKPGDTIWMGAVDKEGRAVSYIQSIYWEFGSGMVAPQTGVLFQNRGHGFSTDVNHPNRLEPGKRPFHTLNPAMARLSDGRVLTYGTMGGEGQPQTQSAVYTRYALYNRPLQQAVTAPRWLLGRTWGEETMTLKLENRFDEGVVEQLRSAGHAIDLYGPFDNTFGHAGAIARHSDGLLEGASDPRSDGSVAAY